MYESGTIGTATDSTNPVKIPGILPDRIVQLSKPILVGFGLFFNLRCLGIITMSFDSGLPNYFLYMQCVF